MLENLTTETRNEKTMNLDEMSTIEFLKVMNDEDAKVAAGVRLAIPQIAKAVEAIVEAKRKGGRLIYIGAGTSGRIGLLDAVECPPTFGTESEEVIGLIAGGKKAFIKAVEGAEDNKGLGIQDLKDINLTNKDIVVGIAASGRTPYVIGGLEYANSIGTQTVAVSCNKGSAIGREANIAIEVNNGPEVLTGSTRLKAGTSQKLICNMLSTASMVGLGKVYGNLMVDLQLTNEKLVERAKHIVMEATSCDYETAELYLSKADNKPKIAIVMILAGFSKEEAIQRLKETQGFIRQAVK
ncbi:N-acetylmuramic acid 6-phosphate etherase [Bacillus sp. R86525]|uniref:N-acetylmuramic acid 6-phosphate etherase n=1 Tax=Bacillus sp. R86525 TaxID=3101709 RepID=UPI00366EEDB1